MAPVSLTYMRPGVLKASDTGPHVALLKFIHVL